MEEKLRIAFLGFQKNERTESIVYAKLAKVEKCPENKKILLKIAQDEEAHYHLLKKHTGVDVSPNYYCVWKYYFIARILGITFALKLMESGESNAQSVYGSLISEEYPELVQFVADEAEHEEALIGMINEERLGYMSSVVLGLNDALVEFTGALAGFTLALQDAKLIALTGGITGIAASLSMASSEYLATKSDEGDTKHPVKASLYTGMAYIITVVTLIAPFMIVQNVLLALGIMLASALAIIALFNYYYCTAKAQPFKKRFLEMAILSFSVAGVSFLIGYLLRECMGIDA